MESELLDCWPRIGAAMHECFQGGTGFYLCHLGTLILGNQGGKGLYFLLESVIRPGVGIRGQPGPVNLPCPRPPVRPSGLCSEQETLPKPCPLES